MSQQALSLFGELPHWAMERNLVLQAGAGTGKTHALVTLALHQLAGANARRKPVHPSRLVALTFTEKAGAEMRDRLSARMAPLAEGARLEETEPELSHTLSLLGVRPPTPQFWARARRDLSLATVGTFHAFCAAQLRRLSAQAGLDPAFGVLDGDDAGELFNEASESAVLEALVAGNHDIRLLVDEFGLSDDKPKGLVVLAREVLSKLAEDGLDPSTLDDGRFDDARASDLFDSSLETLKQAAGSLTSAATEKQLVKLSPARDAMLEVLARTGRENAESCIGELQALRKSFRKPSGEAGLPVAHFDDALGQFQTGVAALKAAPLARAFVRLLQEIDVRYQRAKEVREALDFSDLQRLLREVLARHPDARREVKSRIEMLLVDEFQDTSRLQLDLVALLAETRNEERVCEGPRAAEQLDFEPGLLCVVGDRKQSIYAFRGADVAVFSTLVEAATGRGARGRPARIEQLQKSWRSRPALVHFVNALFRRAMSTASEAFEVAFTQADALDPQMKEPESGPLVELIESQGENSLAQRRDEAERIAARIDAMLRRPERSLSVRDRTRPEGWRPAEGRDIAILFRKLTNLDLYRSALSRRGLAHVVVGGSGFYDSLEVSDAWALLRTLDDQDDALSMAALLRSPFCLLSDNSLVELALPAGKERRPLSLRSLLKTPPSLSNAAEEKRLHSLLSFARLLSPELDRLGCARTLSLALDSLDYLAVASIQSDADQVAANLVRLREVLEALETRSATSRGAIRELGERIRLRRRAPSAAASEESDPRALRLMSIHQSKGLEFPVVFIADCGATEPVETDALAFDRDLGLALSVRSESAERWGGPGLQEVRERLKARAEAESLRLLYVAATRAKDHLIFTGARKRHSWMELVSSLGEEHFRPNESDLELPPELEVQSTTPEIPAVPTPPPQPLVRLRIAEATATVTRLQDFDLCPERYRLRHELGLDEHPPALVVPIDGDLDTLDGSLDALSRGTLAHRLLERFDFAPLTRKARERKLEELVLAEGYSPQREEIRALIDSVETFLDSPHARALGSAVLRLRELPFFLSFDAGADRRLHLKGQIDLVAIADGLIRVVDYKQSRAESHREDQYDFQLGCYALAARELTGGAALPLETSVVFLEGKTSVRTKILSPDALVQVEERLRTLARNLLDAHESALWPRRERAACDAFSCGYRTRCWGRDDALRGRFSAPPGDSSRG